MSSVRLALLGDSIAAGQGARFGGGLGPQLRERLVEQGYDVELNVRALSGSVSAGLAPQVATACAWRPTVSVVVIGANDLIHLVPPQDAVAHLRAAVRDLRACGSAVVAVTAPDLSIVPAVPAQFRALLADVGAQFAGAQAQAVRDKGGIVASLATELGSMFAKDRGMFSADAFHPSDAGYAALATALLPYVLQAVTETDTEPHAT